MQKTRLEILSAPAQKELPITIWPLWPLWPPKLSEFEARTDDNTTKQRQDYIKSVNLFWVGFNHLRPMWDMAPNT